MRSMLRVATAALVLALASPGWAETAIELKKELLPKIKKAQAEGKDLGPAATEFQEGDKAMRDGLQDEALEHFKKAKELMSKDS